MFFLRQMRQAASSFSTSTASYGSYHGRSLNSFGYRSETLTPYFMVCSTIGSYFGLKMASAAAKYLPLANEKDEISDSERTSPRKP